MKEQFFKKTISDIKKELEAPDQKIIALYQVIDKFPKITNELFESLRIITDTIYPTLEEDLDLEEYCLFLLNEKNITNDKITKIKNLCLSVYVNEEEKENINVLSKTILELINLKKKIEKEAHSLAEKNYPNFCYVAGTKLACQMLVISGSLKRLSRMPSSTIQLLGAEKSLFKILKMGGKKTPKYGVLYNHHLILKKNKKEKGKLSRFLSGKIVIAIKADLSNKNMIPELKTKIENVIKP